MRASSSSSGDLNNIIIIIIVPFRLLHARGMRFSIYDNDTFLNARTFDYDYRRRRVVPRVQAAEEAPSSRRGRNAVGRDSRDT